jgi:hypothetical protein
MNKMTRQIFVCFVLFLRHYLTIQSDWPIIIDVAQDGLVLEIFLLCSRVLGLKACTTTPKSQKIFKRNK